MLWDPTNRGDQTAETRRCRRRVRADRRRGARLGRWNAIERRSRRAFPITASDPVGSRRYRHSLVGWARERLVRKNGKKLREALPIGPSVDLDQTVVP